MELSAIGTGNWGSKLIRKFQSLCGIHLVYGHQNREKLQGVTFTEDIDELIDKSEAIIVATPPQTHYELARRVIELEKDVWIEKPMTLSSGEARELANLGDEHECIVFVNHLFCYSEVISCIEELGEIEHVHARSVKTSRQREINSDWNLGIHMVAMAVLLGASAENISLETSHRSRVHEQIFTVKAKDKAPVAFNMRQGKQDLLLAACHEFIEAMQQRRKPLTDGWHGAAVIEAMEQICPGLRSWRFDAR